MLKYIGETIVHQPEGYHKPQFDTPRLPDPAALPPETPATDLRALLAEGGPRALTDWIRSQDRLLITDTTFRDAQPVRCWPPGCAAGT